MRIPGAVRFFTAPRATHAVYGSIVVLAVVTGLDEASASARQAFLGSVGAALAVVLAEIYADMIGTTLREKRPPNREEWQEFTIDVAFGFGAACFPALSCATQVSNTSANSSTCGWTTLTRPSPTPASPAMSCAFRSDIWRATTIVTIRPWRH